MKPETERMLHFLASDSVGKDEATIRAGLSVPSCGRGICGGGSWSIGIHSAKVCAV